MENYEGYRSGFRIRVGRPKDFRWNKGLYMYVYMYVYMYFIHIWLWFRRKSLSLPLRIHNPSRKPLWKITRATALDTPIILEMDSESFA